MKPTTPSKNAGLRSLASIVVAWVLFVQWHGQFGRFMFFEQRDPPAADPHRTQHLRDAYLIIYGILGVVLGFIAALRNHWKQAAITIVFCAILWFVLRYRGAPEFFNSSSEEGYYGIRALLFGSLAVLILLSALRSSFTSRAFMPAESDIRPVVQRHSALPMERLRIVSRYEDLRLTEISRGVVFVFASWSGPAMVGFKRFTQVMSDFPAAAALDLVILDTDCLANESALQLFGTEGFPAGGNGETLWVRDGAIIAREIAAPADSEPRLYDHTRALLA